MKGVVPLLWDCVPFLVVLWWGCKGFGGERLKIFDYESRLRWYMINKEGLSEFT